tara:strand:+ start:2206 stop:2340 length:135 start_codon:yes stop_codon:yes gene_type:complete
MPRLPIATFSVVDVFSRTSTDKIDEATAGGDDGFSAPFPLLLYG